MPTPNCRQSGGRYKAMLPGGCGALTSANRRSIATSAHASSRVSRRRFGRGFTVLHETRRQESTAPAAARWPAGERTRPSHSAMQPITIFGFWWWMVPRMGPNVPLDGIALRHGVRNRCAAAAAVVDRRVDAHDASLVDTGDFGDFSSRLAAQPGSRKGTSVGAEVRQICGDWPMHALFLP